MGYKAASCARVAHRSLRSLSGFGHGVCHCFQDFAGPFGHDVLDPQDFAGPLCHGVCCALHICMFASMHVGHDEMAQACATLEIIATCSLMLALQLHYLKVLTCTTICRHRKGESNSTKQSNRGLPKVKARMDA